MDIAFSLTQSFSKYERNPKIKQYHLMNGLTGLSSSLNESHFRNLNLSFDANKKLRTIEFKEEQRTLFLPSDVSFSNLRIRLMRIES